MNIKSSSFYTVYVLACFPCFEKIKVDLLNRFAVPAFVYMYPAQQPLNSCAEIYEIDMYTMPPETNSAA
jgi:hypothetical protein